jgi:hypothetical protein
VPKKIITEQTLPIALAELDRWSGKLTWALFAERLAEIFGEKSISRHTLLSYPELVDAFNGRKKDLKEFKQHQDKVSDITLESALKKIDTLEASLSRLERENAVLTEQFVRWQHNLYMMPGVDLEKLNREIDKPLVPINRRE